MQSKPSVSAIVVTWNSEKDIDDCLVSLQNQDYPNLNSIIVVDNNSSDSTKKIVQDYDKTFPKIELLDLNKNTFFTGGNNIGIKFALENFNSDYVALLNPDAYASPEWISTLVELAESDATIGILSAKTLFWHNENQGKINSAGLIFDGFLNAYDRGFEEEDRGQYNETQEIVAVTGANMLLRSEMLRETGFFWENLKMYLEDLELCLRAKKYGWKVIYTGKTSVGHKYMQSTNQSSIVRKKGWLKRNFLLLALRHYPFKSKLAMLKKYTLYKLLGKDY